MKYFSRENIGDTASWGKFKKVVATRAQRIDGPFEVKTTEGNVVCEDGWLCIDARGHPYPVGADEFAMIYEPVCQDKPVATVATKDEGRADKVIADRYLGGGVYVSFDGYHLWLDTRAHVPVHRIALEPAVLAQLDRYRRDLETAVQKADREVEAS